MYEKFDKKIQALWGPQVFFDLLNCQTSGIFRSYCQDGAAPPPLTPKRRHFSFPARFSQVHDFEHENLLYIPIFDSISP